MLTIHWGMLRERPQKKGGYTTLAPTLDLTTSLRGDFDFHTNIPKIFG